MHEREYSISRSYLHSKCGGVTVISGYDFDRLSNPFSHVPGTMCCGCNQAVPLREVIWTDTEECIADYRKRLRAEVSLTRRLLFVTIGPATGALLGFLVGFPSMLLLIGPIGNRPWWSQDSGWIGGGVTAVCGAVIGLQLITPWIMKTFLHRDFRLRK